MGNEVHDLSYFRRNLHASFRSFDFSFAIIILLSSGVKLCFNQQVDNELVSLFKNEFADLHKTLQSWRENVEDNQVGKLWRTCINDITLIICFYKIYIKAETN